jgi:hypothetical protein
MPKCRAVRETSLPFFSQKMGSYANGMKLASGLLLYQLLTQCWPRCDHEREALRSPRLDARLHAMRADGDDDQRSSRTPAARRAEPSPRIENAEPLHAEVWESG